MKASEFLSFCAGAAVAAGVTLLFTTEKGKEIRKDIADNLSKEEIDKLIDKLKNLRKDIADKETEPEEVEAEVINDDSAESDKEN